MNTRRNFLQSLFVTPIAASLLTTIKHKAPEIIPPAAVPPDRKIWLQMMHEGEPAHPSKVWAERSIEQFDVQGSRVYTLKPIQFPELDRTITVSQIGVSLSEDGPTVMIINHSHSMTLGLGDSLRIEKGSFWEGEL